MSRCQYVSPIDGCRCVLDHGHIGHHQIGVTR